VSSEPRSTQQGADVWLVPHTHWDREWYEPFQRFRLRLVDLMDDVTSRSQAQPGFRFTMDGQMAAVEDYLEVRPEQREVGAEELVHEHPPRSDRQLVAGDEAAERQTQARARPARRRIWGICAQWPNMSGRYPTGMGSPRVAAAAQPISRLRLGPAARHP